MYNKKFADIYEHALSSLVIMFTWILILYILSNKQKLNIYKSSYKNINLNKS